MTFAKYTSLLFVSLLLISCGRSGPKEAVMAMNDDLCKTKDLSVLSKYVTEESQRTVGMLSAMMSEPRKSASIKKDLDKKCETKLEVVSEKIDGDTAVVETTQDKGEKAVKLKRVNGQWKVIMTKN